MGKQRFETEIDGAGFRLIHLGVREAIRFEVLALKTFGPAIAQVAANGALDPATILGVVANADVATVFEVIDMLAPICEVVTRDDNGKERVRFLKSTDAFNETFQGRGALKWKWLGWCVQCQLGDFFGGSPSA